jgi:hypothetical protein
VAVIRLGVGGDLAKPGWVGSWARPGPRGNDETNIARPPDWDATRLCLLTCDECFKIRSSIIIWTSVNSLYFKKIIKNGEN